jgi:hypothetical protein
MVLPVDDSQISDVGSIPITRSTSLGSLIDGSIAFIRLSRSKRLFKWSVLAAAIELDAALAFWPRFLAADPVPGSDLSGNGNCA